MESLHAQAPLAVTKQSSDELVKELFLRAILSWPLNVSREMLHVEPIFCIRYVIELVLSYLSSLTSLVTSTDGKTPEHWLCLVSGKRKFRDEKLTEVVRGA